MIKDKLVNAQTYFKLSEGIKSGLKWLMETDLNNISEGKYIIDAEKVWANVQEYITKSDAKFEAHRKYIDIQYVVTGSELVGVTDLSDCNTCVKYDGEKDLEFFDCKKDFEYQKLNEGEFLILFPHDAHKPSISCNNQSVVKKVVVKVAVD